MSRLETIGNSDDSEIYSVYAYLGTNKILVEENQVANMYIDYSGGSTAIYYFDRFGRVADQLWSNYNGDPLDHYAYTYDRTGNRTSRENVVSKDQATPVYLDELYTYDQLNQLKSTQRGCLNAAHDAILNGTKNFSQGWDLDSAGNWSGFQEDANGDGTLNLDQQRASNAANETGTIAATTGTNWADPTYDQAGNMLSAPKPSDLENSLGLKYDAWNRLVEVSDGEVLVAKYSYDGTGRRIIKALDSQSPGNPNGIDVYEFDYYSGQQIIETRQASGTLVNPPSVPNSSGVKYQYIWSPRYIDAPILRDIYSGGVLQEMSRIFYLSDANYNITALVNIDAAPIERYIYSPYGKVTVLDSDFNPVAGNQTSYDNTILYTGRELDLATGLYYYSARYYDAGLGRFVSRDQIEYMGGVNLYEYVGDNPVSANDPSGLLRCDYSKPVFPTNKSGGKPTVDTTKDPVRIYAEIPYTAEFVDKGDCSCKCCAMEVWVRGYVHFIVGGKVVNVPHTLPGSNQPMDEKEYRQDSPTIKPTGCKINKTDHPGFSIAARTWNILKQRNDVKIEVHYDFEVYTIDTCNNNERIDTYEFHWWLTGTPANLDISSDLAPSR